VQNEDPVTDARLRQAETRGTLCRTRCTATRHWTGWQCVLPSDHKGGHLDWQEAGLDYYTQWLKPEGCNCG